MQLPKYKKKKRIKLKVCQEPGCGREFWGHPIAKYCRNNKNKQHMKNAINRALVAKKKLLIMTVIMTSLVMVSCNVTRTITNQSEYYQRGDTSVVIQTKTVETYDANKKL